MIVSIIVVIFNRNINLFVQRWGGRDGIFGVKKSEFWG